jgi:hypothetical protein
MPSALFKKYFKKCEQKIYVSFYYGNDLCKIIIDAILDEVPLIGDQEIEVRGADVSICPPFRPPLYFHEPTSSSRGPLSFPRRRESMYGWIPVPQRDLRPPQRE